MCVRIKLPKRAEISKASQNRFVGLGCAITKGLRKRANLEKTIGLVLGSLGKQIQGEEEQAETRDWGGQKTYQGG